MGLPVPRWGELARASAHRPQTRANAGRLRGAARRQPPTAGFSAQPRRESSRLGRAARRPLPPRAGRRKFATDRHRRLPRFSRRHSPAVKNSAQAIYLAADYAAAVRAFRAFQAHWQEAYPALVRKLEQDLPELLAFFQMPPHLWRKLRTTNVIERCFVEVRRRTRPMVCFVNELSVESIIYAIFHRFNEQWKNRTLRLFTQAA